jgi:hypothetical protein
MVDGFLCAADAGMIEREEVDREMQRLYLHLFVDGRLDNFGSLQAFLRKRHASVQIVAARFDERRHPALVCVDASTGEQRSHTVKLCHSDDQVARELSRLGMSHEVDEAILQRDTGIVLPGSCVKPVQLPPQEDA